jgi:uncharacterized protein YoxC
MLLPVAAVVIIAFIVLAIFLVVRQSKNKKD